MDTKTPHKQNKIICQYESVKKLTNNDNDYLKNNPNDLVILDECKSFLNHAFSPTQDRNEEINYTEVWDIVKQSKKLIF